MSAYFWPFVLGGIVFLGVSWLCLRRMNRLDARDAAKHERRVSTLAVWP